MCVEYGEREERRRVLCLKTKGRQWLEHWWLLLFLLSLTLTNPGKLLAVDAFLKIDGIKGESTDDKHKDEIDVISWSFGETNSGTAHTGGGGGAGRVNMKDFKFTMRTNKASPKLFQACANGKHINKVVLFVRRSG